MVYVGIDPGLSGGIGWIDDDGEANCVPMPVLDGRPDLDSVDDLLRALPVYSLGIELPQFRPGEGAKVAKTIGVNWGLIAGLLHTKGFPVHYVEAAEWKKVLGLAVRRGKDAPKLTPRQIKEKSIALAGRLFPDADLKATDRCRVKHDGMAEALLIAEYARRLRK